MFARNPIRPPVKGTGEWLEVQQIFFTFQGEGPYMGWPAVFVRLGGCNLACTFCDTEFEEFTTLSLQNVLDEVAHLSNGNKLVVITGGEPFRQPIERLCQALLEQGYKIQIETNGTLFRDIPKEVDIVCSPKNTGRGYQPIREDLIARISALKFIISSSVPGYDNVAEVGQHKYAIPVYVQPMDEHDDKKNKENMDLAVSLALSKGYRLSFQTHKIAGVL